MTFLAALALGGPAVLAADNILAGKLTSPELTVEQDSLKFRIGGGDCFRTNGSDYTGEPFGKIMFTAEGGDLTVASFVVHEMHTAWKK